MKAKPDQQFVEIGELRVGLYVHLDLSWMDHPFPTGSFKITSDEQIDKIRALGLKRIRITPEKKDPRSLPGAAAAGVCEQSSPVVSDAKEEETKDKAVSPLEQQRASLMECERGFAQSAKAFKETLQMVNQEPIAAREKSEGLIRNLVGHIAGEHETCIRLLSESAGDRGSTHAINVTVISLLLGKMSGLGRNDLEAVGLGALLHDIGKTTLPDSINFKDEYLTAAEIQLYRGHVQRGVEIARMMGLEAAPMLIIAQHHELSDGSGFPLRLTNDRISVASRVVSLVDRYDKLCNPSKTSQALTPHEAIARIFSQLSSQFDGRILQTFIKMMGVYPPGSVVQLTDDRYAQVVSVNSARPLKPTVVVYDPKIPAEEALVLDLAAEPELGIRRSVKPAQLPRPALDYLSPRQRVCYFFERARDNITMEAAA